MSARICKGKVILIRQLLPQQYQFRILLYKDGYRDQSLPSEDRTLSLNWGEAWQFLVHLGQLSHMIKLLLSSPPSPIVRRAGRGRNHSYYPGCLLRFRKIKTVVNTVFQIFGLFIGYLLANHNAPFFTYGETDTTKSSPSSIPYFCILLVMAFSGEG